MTANFGTLRIDRKTGNEPLHLAGRPTEFKLLAFWQWAFSNLASNALRGALADAFGVATAC